MPRIDHDPAKEMLRTICVAMFGQDMAVKVFFDDDHLLYIVQKHFTGEKAFVPWELVRANKMQDIEKALRIWTN